MKGITPSRKFLLFCVVFLIGVAVGSKVILPLVLLYWLTAIWLLVLVSGQTDYSEIIAVIATAFFGGWLVWQHTGGEAWLKLVLLENFGERLLTIRNIILDRLYLALPEPHGSVLAGIMFGNRVRLNYELVETFRLVGLSHIIAVSGFHLTTLTAIVRTILKPLLGQRAIVLTFFFIVAFVMITGAPPSILRAAVMASTLLLAGYLGRPHRGLNLLVLAAAILVVFEPKIIFHVGFQLSVLATYGIIRLSPFIVAMLRRMNIPEMLKSIIAQTMAATILTAPILILYFERISLVSPLTNLLIMPVIPLIMMIGLAAALLALAVPKLAVYLTVLAWPPLEWVVRLSEYFAGWRLASLESSFSVSLTALIIVFLVVMLELLNWRFGKSLRQADPFWAA